MYRYRAALQLYKSLSRSHTGPQNYRNGLLAIPRKCVQNTAARQMSSSAAASRPNPTMMIVYVGSGAVIAVSTYLMVTGDPDTRAPPVVVNSTIDVNMRDYVSTGLPAASLESEEDGDSTEG